MSPWLPLKSTRCSEHIYTSVSTVVAEACLNMKDGVVNEKGRRAGFYQRDSPLIHPQEEHLY